HDLRELRSDPTRAAYERVFAQCSQLMLQIVDLAKPVIAEVHGIATAAGCQLVATCDLAVAAEDARFATPGVNIGLFCSTPMVALTRAIGRKRAMEMLLTGAPIDARTAADWGLVNHVVPDAQLTAETRKLALQIVQASALTIGIGKQAFYAQIDLDQAKAYDYTKQVMSLNAMAADAQEGIGAFLDKRKPNWCGR
ncbi:MAG: enoyl-CoA hydratase-related protein, partial [Candidatus Binataceae bacterium]